MGKQRPAVVVSNSVQNSILDSVVVVPFSSQEPEIPYLRIKLKLENARQMGFAVLPGIRQIKKSRILKSIGYLSPHELKKLDTALTVYLSD